MKGNLKIEVDCFFEKELTLILKPSKNSFLSFPSLSILVKDLISLNKEEVIDLFVITKGSLVFEDGM